MILDGLFTPLRIAFFQSVGMDSVIIVTNKITTAVSSKPFSLVKTGVANQ
jgi:hypothetical protein